MKRRGLVLVTLAVASSLSMLWGSMAMAISQPTISGVLPSSIQTAGGDSITITGTNFVATPTVTIGGVSATSVNFVDSTTLVAVSPAHSAGQVSVVVKNSDGGTATLATGPTYVSPPPTISSITPSSGPLSGGTSLTISGTNFMKGLATPDPTTFTKVWYVSPTGNDTTGNGSASSPYASLNKAVNVAATGDAINILPGTYHAIPFSPTGSGTCINDLGKKLTIYGSNNDTVLECYGSDVTARDANVATFTNSASSVSNLKINYYPNKGSNYSNAIFKDSVGTYRNLYVENKSTTTSWSYDYDNGNHVFYIINSVFNANGRSTSDYTGNGTYINDIFSATPSNGTKTYSLTRAIATADWDVTAAMPSTILNLGDPTIKNPDGTRSNIGVRGGTYAWDGQPPKVLIGGKTPTSSSYQDASTLIVKAPASATVGPVNVVITNGDGQVVTATGGYTYTYDYPAPTISSVSPAKGSPAGGTSVTISGNNFRKGYLTPSTSSSSKVWYVSPGGDDTVGDGSITSPVASLYKAVNSAASGDSIDILPGTYHAIPFSPTGSGTCINDLGKKLTIFGSNNDSVLECYGSDVTARDANVATLTNTGSVASNLKINYYPNKSSSYSNAIFKDSVGTYKNLYVENKSTTTSWSYDYDNGNHAFYVINSVFNANGRSTSDYSGNGTYTNDVFSATPSNGTKTYSLTRTIAAGDWDNSTAISSDLVNVGDPTILNPDGSRSSIGVRGGPYSWEAFVTVTFGGVSATSAKYIDANTIQVVTPAHAGGAVDVSVTNPDGQTATLSGGFIYSIPPTITGITPASDSRNGGASVVITGTNFLATPTVTFGSVPAVSVTWQSSTTLVATVPAHPVGTYDVSITNPDSISSTLAGSFTYYEAPPTITGVSPAIGDYKGGTPVTITGTNLVPGLGKSPTLSQYKQVFYISPTGNDTTGDGSQARPYATYIKALSGVVDGDAIVFLPGTYTLDPISLDPTYRQVCIYDNNKNLAVIGSGSSTIINCSGGTLRDMNVFSLANANSSVSDLSVNYTPTKGANYSNAIFSFSLGTYNNIYVENKSASVSWSYVYDNNNNALHIVNSTFKSNGRSTGDYSGNATYTNCLFDVTPSGGSKNYSLTRTVTSADISDSVPQVVPSDLANTGSPSITNPDGSRSNIGVQGGLYPWGKSLKVYFGGVDARVVSFSGTSAINVITPAHTGGIVDVQVVSYDGQSYTLANSFNYSAPPGQFTVSPSKVLTSGGDTVTISGSYFFSGATVKLGSASTQTATFVDANTLTIVTPAQTAGTYDVTVTNPDSLSTTLTNGITYVEPAPTIASVTPASGPTIGGTTITISGTNFNLGATGRVTLDGLVATNVNQVDGSTITATTPAHATGSVDVVVKNYDGQTVTLVGGFMYLPDNYAFLNSPLKVRENEPGAVTVAAEDAAGNPVISNVDIVLQLSSDTSTGFFARNLNEDASTRWNYNTVVLPANSSQVTFYYKDNLKGTPTITVIGPGSPGPSVKQRETITSKYRLLVTGVTNPVKSGIPSSITLQAIDYNGQPLHDYVGKVHFSSGDNMASLPQDFQITAAMLGGHTFVNGVTMVTQGSWCVDATDTQDSDITGAQCGISVTPPNSGTIAKLSIITPSYLFPANGQTESITVQTQDTNGSPVPVSSDKPLYLFSDSATGQFSPDGTTWNNSGTTQTVKAGTTATTFYYRDSAIGQHHITVSDDSTLGADFGWTNATQTETTGVGSAYRLKITPPAAPIVAGQGALLHISQQDSLGNDVPALSDQTAYVTTSSGNAQFSYTGDFSTSAVGTAHLTIPAGETGIDVYYKDTLSGLRSITASDSSPANGDTGLLDDTANLDVTSDAPAALAFTTAPTQVIAGDLSSTITVGIRDQYANLAVATKDTKVYLSGSQAGATFYDATGSQVVSYVTIPTGQSTADFKIKQTQFTPTQTIIATDNATAPDGAAGLADANQSEVITTGGAAEYAITPTNPGPVMAGVAAGPFSANLRNQFGVIIPSAGTTALYLRSSSIGGSFSLDGTNYSAAISNALADGQSSQAFYYKDTVTGTTTITASDQASGADTGLTDANQTLSVTAGLPAKLHVTTSAQTTQSGQASNIVTVRLEDQYGNSATASQSTKVNLTTNSGSLRFDTASGGQFNGSVTSVTIATGQQSASFYYKDTVAGTPQISLSSGSLAVTNQTETVSWGAVTKITISGANTALAGQPTAAVYVNTLNAYNVQVPVAGDLLVNLTSTAGSGRFDTNNAGSFDGSITSVIVPTNQNSSAFYYRDTVANAPTITATAGSLSANSVITISAAAPAKLAFAAGQQTLELGQSGTFNIKLLDQYDNPTKTTTPTTINLSSSSTNGLLKDDAGNVSTTTTIPANTNGGRFYYSDTSTGTPSLTISSGGLSSANQNVTIIYGAVKSLSMSTSSNNLIAGQPSTLITLYTVNGYGQVVPVTSNTTINLSSNSTTGKFDAASNGTFTTTSLTIFNGGSSTTFYYKDTATGSPTIYGSSSGLTSANYIFNVSAGVATSFIFLTQPTTTVAGNVSSSITVGLRDQYGNVAIAQTSLPISIASTETSAKVSLTNNGPWTDNPLSAGFNIGDQTVTFYYEDTVAGNKNLTVSASGLSSATQVTTVTAAGLHHLGFLTAPQTIVAQNASGVITVGGYDQYNNRSNLVAMSIKLSSGSNAGTFSANASNWSTIDTINISAGSSSQSFYYKDSNIGSTTLTVQDASNTYPPINQAITVKAGTVTKLRFTSDSQTIVKATPSQLISVSLADQFDYINTDSQDHMVHLASSSAGGEFSLDSQTWSTSLDINYAIGTATQQFYYRDSQTSTATMTASTTNLISASQDITIIPGTISKVVLSAASQVTAGQASSLLVQTTTTEGLPAAVAADTTIQLISVLSGQFSLSNSDWQPISSVTIKAGQYQLAVYYKGISSGTDNLTAKAPAANNWADGTTSIVVNAAAPTKIVLVSSPAAVGVGSPSDIFVVQIQDQFGNLTISGSDRTLYLFGAASGQFATSQSGPWTVSNLVIPAGTASVSFYYSDTIPGRKTLTVADSPQVTPDPGLTNATTLVAITSLPPSSLKYTSSAQTINAGEFSGPVTIEADQSDGQVAVLANEMTINLSSDNAGGAFYASSSSNSPITTVKIPIGGSSVTVYFKSTLAASSSLTAAADTVSSASQAITIKAAAPTKLTFVTAEQSKAAGVDSDQMRVQLQDQYGNASPALSDVTVKLTSTDKTGSFSINSGAGWSPITEITIAKDSADAYFYYHDTTAGAWGLTAQAPGVTDASQNFSVAVGEAVKLQFVSTAQNLVAGQPSQPISLQLQDQYGNLVANPTDLSIYLSSDSAGGVFSDSPQFTNVATEVTIQAGTGQKDFYYKDTVAGNATITAADTAPATPDTGLTNASQAELIDAGSSARLNLTGNNSIQAGQALPLVIHLANVYGVDTTAQEDLNVYLGSSNGGQFSTSSDFSSTITNIILPKGDKTVTVYYKGTTAGNSLISATDQLSGEDIGLVDATLPMTTLPANMARLIFTTLAPNLQAYQPSNAMVVQAQDIYGNAVPAVTDLTLYLGSTSMSASFSATSDFGSLTNQVVIVNGSTSATFYYKDAHTGTPTITAADQASQTDTGLVDATQTATITAGTVTKLVWTTNPSLEAGEVTQMTVQAQNAYGVPTPVSDDTTIYLTHSSSNGGFSATTGGPWTLSSTVIPAGQYQVSFYYRSTVSTSDLLIASDTNPSSPDTGIIDAALSLSVAAGTPTQIAIASSTYSIAARHTSPASVAEIRNAHGTASPVATDTLLYVRTSSSNGEFSPTTSGPWGVNYITVTKGSSSAGYYYHDPDVGTPTLTISDTLPAVPDVGLTNASQKETITAQVVNHLLITNISTPQIQGSPSSIVVQALDNEGYIVSDYAGTVSFSSSDSDAILPGSYTFVPSVDRGIHTFTNAAAFLHTGVKTVTVTDKNGLTGVQSDIIVNGNNAGPIAKLEFSGITPPLILNKGVPSDSLTIQAVDSNGQPSNAPDGGFPIRLTSSSAQGKYSTSPNGPWSSTLITTIPVDLSSVNVYYQDASIGTPILTASDWVGAKDDASITNASLQALVHSLSINVTTTLQINNNSHYYETSPIIFSKNSNGDYYGQVDFASTITDETSGSAVKANLTFTLKDPDGNTVGTQTAYGSSYTYHIQPIQGTMKAGNYSLTVAAVDPVLGTVGTKTVTIPLSGWVVQISYDPDNRVIGQPLPYTVTTKYNGVLTDAPNFGVNFRDDNGDNVTGVSSQLMSDLTRTGPGQYSGSIPTTGLQPTDSNFSNAYYLYIHVFDNTNPSQKLAEDNHYDIFFKNNPALAPQNFQIEKVLTSTPPANETYNLKFSWNASADATNYVIYRTQNKFAGLYTDPCSIYQVQTGHRYGDTNSRTPFCETQGQQNVGSDDTSQWVELATVNAPTTSVTIPWAQLQTDLPGSVYYYIVRAENGVGSAGYSTMAVSVKRHFTTNSSTSSVNWLALPYNNGTFTNSIFTSQHLLKASDIVNDIEGGTGNGTNKKISRLSNWSANIQSTSSAYFYNSTLHKWSGTDFAINPGDAVYLQATYASGFDWEVVGSDNTVQLNLKANTDGLSNVNWLSIPYSGMYRTASDIVNDIEGGTGSGTNKMINRLSTWSVGIQSTSSAYFYNSTLHKWSGADFTLTPGEGVYLQLSGGQLPLQLTPPLILNPNQVL